MNDERATPATGLCASCVHARAIESSKAAVFIRCERSFVDPAYPRYPVLPVRNCAGYVDASPDAKGADRAGRSS